MTGTKQAPVGQDLIRKLECYSTSTLAVEELLRREQFSDLIWEPANGVGSLTKTLIADGYDVFTSDIKRWHRTTEVQRDFHMFTRTPYGADIDIVTNPPFRDTVKFVETAMRLLRRDSKLALILPTRYLNGKTRKKLVFDKFPPIRVYVFSYRIPRMHQFFYTGNKGRSIIDFAWFVWEKGWTGNTIVEWI